ncbi:MAG TPA: molybdate ABC transporter permease subunit [Pyrinomonadaceae bacterium]|nr:molybdate ABC transporter permease subunit [Pyrinomonadaceae bacterium]
MNWAALRLSLQVTIVATTILFVVGLVLGVVLARFRVRGQIIIETIIFLPLVLPPSVIGYFLLLTLGRGSPIVEWFHVNVLFTWQAAAIASAVVGLPLMVQSARAAIASVDQVLENAARTLGSSELEILWRVTLPLARRGIIAGLILGGARALGEFGATLMVAGNIPGQTQTLPLAIYDAVQARRYEQAQMMVILMTAIAFVGLWCVRQLERPLHERKTPLG